MPLVPNVLFLLTTLIWDSKIKDADSASYIY